MILVQTHAASPSLTNEYINNNQTNVIIDKFVCNNTDASDHTLTVYIVPSGNGADATNCIMTVPVKAGQAYLCGELVGFDLAPLDSLWIQSSAAGFLVIRGTGRIKAAE